MAPTPTNPPEKPKRTARAAKKTPAPKKAAAAKKAPAKKASPPPAKTTARTRTPKKSGSSVLPPRRPGRLSTPARAGLVKDSAKAEALQTPQATRVSPRRLEQSRAPGTPLALNVPPNFTSTFSWFFHGLTRQPTGVVVALLAGYTALVISLWYAVIGLILGVLVALGAIHKNGVTQALFHAVAGTSVTAVAVATGALVGAGGGFTSFYTKALLDNPYQVLGGIVAGGILAIVIVSVIALFEGNLLELRGCRKLSEQEVRRISPLLQQMGTTMSLRNAPRFAMKDVRVPNAWAHMRHIVLTTGLLNTLDDPQLAAVIGHELHHWRTGDSVGQHFVWACAWPIVLVYNVAYLLTRRPQTRDQQLPQPTPPHNLFTILIWIIAWPAWLLIKFPITLAIHREMRQQEYDADKAVNDRGHGQALISALRTLSQYEGGRTGWEAALYATHPPTELRIERLSPASVDTADYLEPALGAETSALLNSIYALALVFALFIAWGAVINAHRANVASAGTAAPTQSTSGATPSQPQQPLISPDTHDAESVAAHYTVAYIDNVFDAAALQQVVSQYVVPASQQQVLNEGAPYLYGANPSALTSSAQSVACSFSAGSATDATVGVFVRWTTSLSPSSEWFTNNITLTKSGSQWMATNPPGLFTPVGTPGNSAVPTQYADSTVPSGYGPCP